MKQKFINLYGVMCNASMCVIQIENEYVPNALKWKT